MSLLIAVPPEVQINTHKIVKGVLYWTDNSTTTADYDSAHANYTVNYIRQLQNHDYIHMTTTTSYKSILLHVTLVYTTTLAVNNIGFLEHLIFGLVPVYVYVKILYFHQILEQKNTNKKVMQKVLKLCKF